ncbi:hypothetical protein [Burkholderia metallica]|uniref:hypothetical protein n=1 Tax=Burkholderia metallica TaxID=488729 RepID=UPI0014548FA6|nr:hypothetical protein [Burkholderia metallica]VWB29225.1 hypothetical protein BME24068_01226 [Burkholderia metallica]
MFDEAGHACVRDPGVPVIMGPAAMAKLAEAVVDRRRSLGLTKSEVVTGTYRTTPAYIHEELQAMGKKLVA